MSVSVLLLLASLTGAAGVAGGLVGRRRLVARMRADRVRMVAVANPDFEPSVDALRDMVGAIGRARSWRVPARAQTVRCEFVCSEHKLAVVYEMPARLMRAARLALPEGLQLVDVDFAKRFSGMDSDAVRVGPTLSADTARCEFRIVAGRGHRLPPAPPELDLTRNLGELARRCGAGESVTLMVDVAPLRRSAVKAWRKELVEDSRPASTRSLRGGGSRKPSVRRSSSSGDLIGQVVDDVQDLLTGGAGVGASSEARQGDVVLHRHEGAAVQRALAEPRPVHVQLLAVANSDRGGRDRAGLLLSMLHSAIAPLGSPGEAELVKRSGRKHVARRLRSEDGPLLRPGFDARARSGWMTGAAAVCTMTEITPLLRPPTRHAKSDAIARTVLVPAPRFPKWKRQRGLLPMGVVIDHEHALRSPQGKWGKERAWLKVSKVKHPWPDDLRWLDGGNGDGVLLVERRLRTGSSGLALYGMRRTSNGQWGKFMRDDPSDRNRYRRSLSGIDGRLASTVATQRALTVRLMNPSDRSWGPAVSLASGSDECRTQEEQPQLQATPAAVYVAWRCSYRGGSSAVATAVIGWDARVRARSVIDDRRAWEDATQVPADNSAPQRPAPILGTLDPAPGGARLSWMRADPGAVWETTPDMYEALIDPVGTTTPPAKVSTGASILSPPAPQTTRTLNVSGLGSHAFLLKSTDSPPRPSGLDQFTRSPGAVERELVVHRTQAGQWQSTTVPDSNFERSNIGEADFWFSSPTAMVFPGRRGDDPAFIQIPF